ncbi:hypothetical protein ANRL1_00898 [Anaerolineae bacterium]|nr:hypothetical protein ANRL1_00898 [Anaerolineae bacterium]
MHVDPAHLEFAENALPLNWLEVAKLLHENARALHDQDLGTITQVRRGKAVTRRTSNRPVFLLAAFALENLLKAFLIYENPKYIEGGKLSRQLLNGHGLSQLQAACRKIPSPKRTRHVFETLEVGINSWARYPCATSVARETEEREVTDAFWREYNKVFDLYCRRLETLLVKRWTGPYGKVGYVTFTAE